MAKSGGESTLTGSFFTRDTATFSGAYTRAKLEADPMRPELILTVRGAGYKMRDIPA